MPKRIFKQKQRFLFLRQRYKIITPGFRGVFVWTEGSESLKKENKNIF
uniref:Uncharacterized protein n=1 Tax=Meloidogyne enterolobii TaxID=390850 RepID=A0A6V7XBY5_MELEN|nr:unnamed protein product [Meloidogyne enterolobii]